MKTRTVITGTGCYIPRHIKSNRDFISQKFYTDDNQSIDIPQEEIVEKFQLITGIEERRYIQDELNSSDMATMAAQDAIAESGIEPETLDQIIVAHNFGNVIKHTIQTDILPALASRVKHDLGIRNPACVPYDILFGCPGWLQGIIQSDTYMKAGIAQKILVIGTETLSRVLDPYDRDSMIFSDGAGAAILEAIPEDKTDSGVLSWCVQSHCSEEAFYLHLGKSNHPEADCKVRYIKMKGRKVYEYAMQKVPAAMKDCLDKAHVPIEKISKIIIHQANEKMDEGIVKRLYRLYGIQDIPDNIMPMNIQKYGNSSVATIPTLFDQIKKEKMTDHIFEKDDIILFASVGAGMNINAICYRI
ncbi:MAG: ketoacyl-ACP synthase III [Chitinophagaceae bacterium]|nr:ketoacyl-ACP synthase III [Chitinophagaceae bacterium]MCB0740537.1 ketoacyl-ACP synthase III [Chitinophagaceae bacterium]